MTFQTRPFLVLFLEHKSFYWVHSWSVYVKHWHWAWNSTLKNVWSLVSRKCSDVMLRVQSVFATHVLSSSKLECFLAYICKHRRPNEYFRASLHTVSHLAATCQIELEELLSFILWRISWRYCNGWLQDRKQLPCNSHQFMQSAGRPSDNDSRQPRAPRDKSGFLSEVHLGEFRFFYLLVCSKQVANNIRQYDVSQFLLLLS